MEFDITINVKCRLPEDQEQLSNLLGAFSNTMKSPKNVVSTSSNNNTVDEEINDSTLNEEPEAEAETEEVYENIDPALYERAWKACSWDVIALAIATINLCDGVGSMGEYTFISTLTSDEASKYCGELNERSVSSRVGRTLVICKKLGNFRLMQIGVRRRDQARRVYMNAIAKKTLIGLLKTDWKIGFEEYLHDNNLAALSLDALDVLDSLDNG